MDLSLGGHSHTLPGLKLPSQQRPWASGQEGDLAPFVQLAGSTERPSPASEPLDPTAPGNITIPRPHGRRTPELGSIIALPVCQSRSRPPGGAGGPTPGGQEFWEALTKSTEGDGAQADASSEEAMDVLSLLDPLSTRSASTGDGGRLALMSAPHITTPPRGSSPQGLPPFPLQPHVFNPFAHGSSGFLPSPSANPFGAGLGPRQGSYPHPRAQPPSFSILPGLFRQQPGSTSAPPPGSTSAPPPGSTSAPPRLLPPRPGTAEGLSRDPFEDLLTVGQSAKTPSRAETLQRRWETFE